MVKTDKNEEDRQILDLKVPFDNEWPETPVTISSLPRVKCTALHWLAVRDPRWL